MFPAPLKKELLRPPRSTDGIPGISGRIRARPDDFQVDEIPAYAPDGQADAHLLFPMTKRGMSTEAALAEITRLLSLPRAAIGVAGLKDAVAVTTQWVSVPATAAAALRRFEHPDIQLGEPAAHGNKLRRGHLRGNRFRITVRDLGLDPAEAIRRVERKAEMLRETGGLLNLFGQQRLGRDAENADAGLGAMTLGGSRRRDQFVLSAAQSALFNLYLARRAQDGALRAVLDGDVLRKRETGGMFLCDDPPADQARLDAGELEITGPIFGSKTRRPGEGSSAFVREQAVLHDAGVTREALRALGRNAPGARRALQVDVSIATEAAPAVEELSTGLTLSFALPAGCFATQLWAELESGEEP